MRILFEKSGGLMGRTTSLKLDLNELPPDQATTLNRLIDKADFLSLKENLVTRAMPDEFNYTITVVTDKVQHTVHASDSSTPESLRPLIQELTTRARAQR
jgi:hypothetical protein